MRSKVDLHYVIYIVFILYQWQQTYLILIISKHFDPQLSHFWIDEVRIASAT